MFGFSWSWKRALGISAAKGRVSRAIGVPLTRSGRERRIGRAMSGSGVGLLALLAGGGGGGGSRGGTSLFTALSILLALVVIGVCHFWPGANMWKTSLAACIAGGLGAAISALRRRMGLGVVISIVLCIVAATWAYSGRPAASSTTKPATSPAPTSEPTFEQIMGK